MATQNIFRAKFARLFEKASKNGAKATSGLKSVLNFLSMLGGGLIMVIAMLLLLAIFTIIYNPIVFWVWTIIAPGSAARSLYNIKGKEDHPLDLPGSFFWQMNRKLDFLLPWRCKREFLRVTCLSEATLTEELRFFNESDKADLIKKNWLSKEAKNRIWTYEGEGIRELLLPSMKVLTVMQFAILVHNDNWGSIAKYFSEYTPSEEMLKILLKKRIDVADPNALKIICNYAKNQSLPVDIINSLYNNSAVNYEDREAIEDALSIYGQKRLIIAGRDNHELWKKFCNRLKGGDGIFPENQILLNLRQYEDYHAVGFSLCCQAIVHFLSKEDMEMAKAVIKHELIEKDAALTGQICTLIEANAKLGEIYLNLLAEAEKK